MPTLFWTGISWKQADVEQVRDDVPQIARPIRRRRRGLARGIRRSMYAVLVKSLLAIRVVMPR
jgi:hypothetical protein